MTRRPPVNTQPDLEPVPGPWWRYSYRLRSAWRVSWLGADGRLYRCTVPAGLRTDGSTEWVLLALGVLPAVVLWLFGVAQDGLHRGSRVLHDYGYQTLGDIRAEALYGLDWGPVGRPLSRVELDHAMRAVAAAAGVEWWRRGPKWLGVRAFGWVVWMWRLRRR